jgi:uncharacterized protein
VIVYADASALAKLILGEDGQLTMQSTVESAQYVASSVIAYAELRAAMAAAHRDGRIAPSERDAVRISLEGLWSTISEVPVDTALVRHAGELAERFHLRGYDAVHLAALIQFGAPSEITFACWDLQLLRAARELGYVTVPS